MIIKTSAFAKGHTATSAFSYYCGTWAELEALVTEHFLVARPGYKDGILIVEVPAQGFFTGVIAVTDRTELYAQFSARTPNEAPFLDVRAIGAKAKATRVEIVLYSRAVLSEEGLVTEADYEIVSINARTTAAPEPMTPMAMARNFLGLSGGTKAEYSAEEFAQSIEFWGRHAMAKQL